MVKNGIFGNSTFTGLVFEKKTSLAEALETTGKYKVVGDTIFLNENEFGVLAEKYKLYRFLKYNKVNWKEFISCRILPDECLITKNKVFIIEKKISTNIWVCR